MRAFYTDIFVLPLPEGHRFPMAKYRLLRERLLETGVIAPECLNVPHAATDAELLRAHDADYVRRVQDGALTHQEIRRIGFPWSAAMVERSRRSSGATIEACYAALQDGVAVNLAGGTHHAFRDRGGGYCVFNDAAVAARTLQAEGLARRVVILDCDVHQGDGTAAILRDDPTIFTFSIHGETNYPFHKEQSDLDIGLPDGTTDAAYLAALAQGVHEALRRADADFAIYLAGADPFEGDQLGKLKISMAGLAARDHLVLGACRAAGLPVAVAMAGGYAKQVEDIVTVHYQTVSIAAGYCNG
ncbi:MAG: histone deacetylase [Chloroflexi bacterium CFX4]|nr:histone deacetylase [Chloroflexi bacterium CFX4]MDL1922950.1 histone deacetylase [Chloroflexi bacterium CFX3]